ncbi:MAG: copper homeostasis periplasmic binding protein CopC [Burkholderiales bacterium]|jgi:methionine-rich copper-binding protein CopC|nr:copper homeostasis periplasmic binding protein CopC [Burkholderiales bacterium]
MKRLIHGLIAAACFLMASSVLAHATLQSSTPTNGSTLATAPTEIRLQFNEPIEITFSSVKLAGPGANTIKTDKAKADKDDEKSIVMPLPALPAGAYKAQWSTVGRDGHRVKGELSFTVK